MVYRRFGTVYARLLLSKQDEMSRMETTLKAMDKADETAGNEDCLKSCTIDADRESIPSNWPESRPMLLARMEKTALEYGRSIVFYSFVTNGVSCTDLPKQGNSSSKRSSSKHSSGHHAETTKACCISWKTTAGRFSKKKLNSSTRKRISSPCGRAGNMRGSIASWSEFCKSVGVAYYW